jgi:hypothetical protein
MSKLLCRQCDGDNPKYVRVELSVLKRTRAMHLLICRDCFRTLEALLETASSGAQPELIEYLDPKLAYPNFLW